MVIHLRDERGFTFIELLVVIIVIGILAAIALPAFLTQKDSGFDAEAKSNARNLLTQVQSCFTEADSYVGCDTQAELGASGLAFGSGPGEVRVASVTADSFRIVATSRGEDGSAYRWFEIAKPGPGPVARTCGPATAVGNGGCPSSGVW